MSVGPFGGVSFSVHVLDAWHCWQYIVVVGDYLGLLEGLHQIV